MDDTTSRSFDRLAPAVQRWAWRQGWKELRDIQEQAIGPILDRQLDVVIASTTASGKTEAAFLPICSDISTSPADGLRVLYVSPLKALINDQYRRLENLFEAIDAPVTAWHGDIAASRKHRVLKNPGGLLLITPESLEALFVTRGSQVPRLMAGLHYVVIDELHAFIGSERGAQLQSLLHRVELAGRARVPRIGLSATLGDMDLACEFLRPGQGDKVLRIVSTAARREVQLQVRGYRKIAPLAAIQAAAVEGASIAVNETAGDDLAVADHLYKTLRSGTHIIFANQRGTVEQFTDLLRRRAERDRVPNEFWPHHGNLSREIREDAENALRSGKPATVIATTTLELGIDVGALDSIAQIGAPQSVTSMRQRLGRSGRREGDPSVLRIYVREEEITDKTAPQDQLRTCLVQSIAMIRLLIQGWTEPPAPHALHLSTLVQQIMSLAAQHGGFLAHQAWRALCDSGPFLNVDQPMFGHLLRDLATHQLVKQTHDGTIVLDLVGERLVNHYEFYAAFSTPDEYRLVAGGRTLGRLPIDHPIGPGSFLIFAGRRWVIIYVDAQQKLVELAPAPGGKPPLFPSGSGPPIHDRVRKEMRATYLAHDHLPFLDNVGTELLAEGRDAFRRFELKERAFLPCGRDTLLFPWAGDRAMYTLLLQLRARGLTVEYEGIALLISGAAPEMVREHLEEIVVLGPGNSADLATIVQNKITEKYHPFLSEPLLCADYGASTLDIDGALRLACDITGADGSST